MISDARQHEAMRHIFAMGGRALWQKSCDAGERWMLADVAGAPLRAWDERGHTKRATYDAARRARHAYVQQGTAAEQLVGRTVYGDGVKVPADLYQPLSGNPDNMHRISSRKADKLKRSWSSSGPAIVGKSPWSKLLKWRKAW